MSLIKRRVMDVVKGKIAEAQKRYDARCKALDEKHLVDVQDLEIARDLGKDQFADDLVNEIVGKIL